MKLLNCHIIITVLALTCLSTVICADDYMYWNNFVPNSISLSNISYRTDTSEGSAIITLNTSGNAEITADHGTAAQLTYSGTRTNRTIKDTLVTKYQISTDGDGVHATGATAAAVSASHSDEWTTYDNFLTTAPLAITHVTPVHDDNDVEVTLHVQASNTDGKLADSGEYTATQTLTVHWIGP
jgi:hypothetical protein